MKAYFISGLAADARVFKHIHLSEGYDPVHISWIRPEPQETLHDYSLRLSAVINKNEPFILIGLSLGGMIASEIAQFLKPEKLIIISSAAHPRQLPAYFKLAGKIGLHKIIPVSLLKSVSLVKRFFTMETSEDKTYLRLAIRQSDPFFVRWAVNAILTWKTDCKSDCIHIHGSEDLLLPLRYTSPTHIIKGGGHMMVMNRAEEINKILNTL